MYMNVQEKLSHGRFYLKDKNIAGNYFIDGQSKTYMGQ